MERISLKAERTEDYRCRVCLEFTEGTVCLLDTVEIKQEALSYWDILLSICKLEIKNDNNIPQKICAICAQGAAASYEFKLLCENSDKILQSQLICNASSSIKADPDDFKFECTEEEINWNITTIKKSVIDQDKSSNENSLDTTENIHCDFANTTPEPFNTGDIVIENVGDISGNNTEINTLQLNQELQPYSFNSLENTDSTEEQGTPDPNNYYCKNCGHKFVLEENLKLHMLMKICKKRTFPVTCFACNYKPTSSIDYYRHRRMHRYKTSKRPSCMYCDYAPTNYPDYQKHLLQFHSDKKIGCEYCSNTYFQPRVLTMHMKQEHPDKSVRCYICNFTTNVYQLYTKHVIEEHSDILQQRKCKFCDYSNVCPIALGKHMEFSHDDKKYIQCMKCKRKFFFFHNLMKHMTVHSGESNFKCKSCNKRFRTSDDLHAHEQVHSKDRKYKCDKCSSQYKSASTLQRHVRIVHTKMKPQKCTVCSKSFISSSHLKDHMITHTGVKDYECDTCGKLFARKTHLEQHMVVHTGVKNYECDNCGKLFARKTHLVQHMVVHTGEKRHYCEVCGKRFTQAHCLKTHLNTHKS